MKFIEKVVLNIYSIIMLVLSIILCLLVFGWLDCSIIDDMLNRVLANPTGSNIVLGVSVAFIILSLICIFFDSSSKNDKDNKQGVLLQNDNGKLMISKDTLENLVNTVAKDFESAEEISTNVSLDKENNVTVFVNLVVSQNAVIKELTANLQQKIKETIKKASDLEVKEVNVKVKNIAPKKDVVSE
jgi:hypothetical protein